MLFRSRVRDLLATVNHPSLRAAYDAANYAYGAFDPVEGWEKTKEFTSHFHIKDWKKGGHNAGHTLVVGNETYKLSLLPSGLVRGKLGIIGNGLVVDPEALLAEIDRVSAQGLKVSPETLRVSESAVLILPVHPAIDRAREGEENVAARAHEVPPAASDRIRSRTRSLLFPSAAWRLSRMKRARRSTRTSISSSPCLTREARLEGRVLDVAR